MDRITGVDRIDNTKGYFLDNVRPSCERHNCMRNDMTDEEFYRKSKEVVKWYENIESRAGMTLQIDENLIDGSIDRL